MVWAGRYWDELFPLKLEVVLDGPEDALWHRTLTFTQKKTQPQREEFMSELEQEPRSSSSGPVLFPVCYASSLLKGDDALKLHPDLLLDHALLRASITASLSFPPLPSSGGCQKHP